MPRKLCFIESALAWVRLEVLRSSRSSAAFSSATRDCTSLFRSDVHERTLPKRLELLHARCGYPRAQTPPCPRSYVSFVLGPRSLVCSRTYAGMLSFTASSRSYCCFHCLTRRYAFAHQCSPLSTRCLTGKVPSDSARTIPSRRTRSCLSPRVYRLRRNRLSNAAVCDRVAGLAPRVATDAAPSSRRASPLVRVPPVGRSFPASSPSRTKLTEMTPTGRPSGSSSVASSSQRIPPQKTIYCIAG